jgi:hypothetical protein
MRRFALAVTFGMFFAFAAYASDPEEIAARERAKAVFKHFDQYSNINQFLSLVRLEGPYYVEYRATVKSKDGRHGRMTALSETYDGVQFLDVEAQNLDIKIDGQPPGKRHLILNRRKVRRPMYIVDQKLPFHEVVASNEHATVRMLFPGTGLTQRARTIFLTAIAEAFREKQAHYRLALLRLLYPSGEEASQLGLRVASMMELSEPITISSLQSLGLADRGKEAIEWVKAIRALTRSSEIADVRQYLTDLLAPKSCLALVGNKGNWGDSKWVTGQMTIGDSW